MSSYHRIQENLLIKGVRLEITTAMKILVMTFWVNALYRDVVDMCWMAMLLPTSG
jgi:hypothetical protein